MCQSCPLQQLNCFYLSPPCFFLQLPAPERFYPVFPLTRVLIIFFNTDLIDYRSLARSDWKQCLANRTVSVCLYLSEANTAGERSLIWWPRCPRWVGKNSIMLRDRKCHKSMTTDLWCEHVKIANLIDSTVIRSEDVWIKTQNLKHHKYLIHVTCVTSAYWPFSKTHHWWTSFSNGLGVNWWVPQAFTLCGFWPQHPRTSQFWDPLSAQFNVQ